MSESQADFDMASITDAKSLYDNCVQEQYTGAERRAALEICVFRDSLESMDGTAHWVPHQENPSDCLTKMRGNAQRLLKLMRDAKYKLVDEEKAVSYTHLTLPTILRV